MATGGNEDNFDWVTAQAGCSSELMFKCRYYIGEAEYLGWEVRKQALEAARGPEPAQHVD
ncbi:MAG TPA: hypothetical protein VFZ31_04945 [Vicinamibacterales bacterium]